MTMIPAFGPWTEHPADTDEEKRLASAQQSKTSPLSVDKEHETGVFYGSGKEPYQTSLASCTCNDFVKRKKPCKHIFPLFALPCPGFRLFFKNNRVDPGKHSKSPL